MEASSVALLLASLLFSAASAVDYTATNNAGGTPGGARFDSEIGLDYGKQVLADASSFCWSIFQQPTEADRRSVQRIALIVESMDGVAYNSNDEIHLSADYVAGYSGDVRTEITGVLYHEVTHSWQWNGRGAANGGLIEGIADFVRLKAGYAPGHWVGPGGGDRWDQGYDVTARFLDYCEGLMAGFVAQLNAKMRDGYSDDFFQQLLGKTVDQLWTDYKAHAVCAFVYPTMCLAACLAVYPAICHSICPVVCPTVCPIVCPTVCPAICPIVCPTVCPVVVKRYINQDISKGNIDLEKGIGVVEDKHMGSSNKLRDEPKLEYQPLPGVPLVNEKP
ncbi:hypothetical protein ZIOFF_013672 [Zingiber officinale]|uniref:Uncharacterized protein n=1 Tax=Zingiber officinale TaxID=94328 RepID=A0A8J5LNZ5_ZINOF|nr:hypothetical protein ZIOFF_013672 [Zingiber officinale]